MACCKALAVTAGVGLIARMGIGGLVVFALVAPWFLKPYGIYILSLWAVMTIAAIGLNITLGYAGQVSLAQGSFVGIGAYVTAILTSHGYPFALAFVIAVPLCFAIGWLLGYPALRVQHHYLAFVTLAFSTLCFLVLRNEEWLTGGIYGISGIPRPGLFGISASSPRAYYYFCLAGLALVALAAWGLIRSPWGRALMGLRENPTRAFSLGVDTRLYTLMAFAIGSTIGGIAGTLYAPLVQYIDPSPFALSLSLNLLLMVVVGGASYFFGPFLGALIAVLLPEWLRFTEGLYLIIYGALVLALMVFCPSGLFGLAQRILRPVAHAAGPAAEARDAG